MYAVITSEEEVGDFKNLAIAIKRLYELFPRFALRSIMVRFANYLRQMKPDEGHSLIIVPTPATYPMKMPTGFWSYSPQKCGKQPSA